jgi:hypothetical protein
MGNTLSDIVWDIVGAVWIIAVMVVFVGLPYGLPEVCVSIMEKMYALCLIAGVVWLAHRTTSSGHLAKEAKRRD